MSKIRVPKGTGVLHGNLHELTWSAVASRKLVLELDQQILLIRTEPGDPEIVENVLRITRRRQVALVWQEYANMRSHAEDHGAVTVTFHGQPA